MLKSCDMAEIDHNMTTLQHESLSLKISADGRCEHPSLHMRQSLADKSLTSLEIIVDATHLHGGQITSIMGNEAAYLPSSKEFTLDHFEPRDDGTCILRYTRREQPSDNEMPKDTTKSH